MKSQALHLLAACFALCSLAGWPGTSRSQGTSGYPAKAIQLVIPNAVGGGVDTVGRIVAVKLGARLGQQVVVENRAGAGGNIGTAFVARAPADGYTLLLTSNGHNINPYLHKAPGYDPTKDFVAVVQVSEAASAFVTGTQSEYRTLADLVKAARAAPGTFSYGSGGNGTPSHLAGEMFKAAANIDLIHVPYKNSGQAYTDVIGGQLPFMMGALPAVMSHVKNGRMRALALTSPRRSAALPDIPVMAESGYPGFSHMTWIGLFAPAGTPAAVVERLNREISAVLLDPEVRERVAGTGAEPVGKSSADFDAMLKAEYDATGAVVKRIGLKAE